MASAVRSVSWQAGRPQETATISVAAPPSFRRTASSTAISSNGFIDILTLAVSTPLPSAFTRTLTLKSTTRFTLTRIFMRAIIECRDVSYVQFDQRVHRERAPLADHHRVDVDRGHLAAPGEHRLAELHRHRGERRHVARRASPEGPQQRIHAQALERLVDFSQRDRRQQQPEILQHLEPDPAVADQQHRAELRVEPGAERELPPARR